MRPSKSGPSSFTWTTATWDRRSSFTWNAPTTEDSTSSMWTTLPPWRPITFGLLLLRTGSMSSRRQRMSSLRRAIGWARDIPRNHPDTRYFWHRSGALALHEISSNYERFNVIMRKGYFSLVAVILAVALPAAGIQSPGTQTPVISTPDEIKT